MQKKSRSKSVRWSIGSEDGGAGEGDMLKVLRGINNGAQNDSRGAPMGEKSARAMEKRIRERFSAKGAHQLVEYRFVGGDEEEEEGGLATLNTSIVRFMQARLQKRFPIAPNALPAASALAFPPPAYRRRMGAQHAQRGACGQATRARCAARSARRATFCARPAAAGTWHTARASQRANVALRARRAARNDWRPKNVARR